MNKDFMWGMLLSHYKFEADCKKLEEDYKKAEKAYKKYRENVIKRLNVKKEEES